MKSILPAFVKRKPNILIHALKCVTMSPAKSHPNNYFKKDKQHFINLWAQAKLSNAQLVLVNYAPNSDVIKRLWVTDFSPITGVTVQKQSIINQKQCKQWLTDLKKTHTII